MKGKEQKRKAERRREELGGCLKAALLGMLAGVIVVFASAAMKAAAAVPADVPDSAEEEEQKAAVHYAKDSVQRAAQAKVLESEESGQEEEAGEEDGETAEDEAGEKSGETDGQKVLYLTFDDGPSAQNTDRVLDVLKEKNIKATFFVIGEYVRKYPETARRIAAEGHTIGIHCDVHDYSTLYASVDSYIEDFEKAYQTVLEVTGVEAKLFRFPGGSVNAYNKDVREEIIAEMEKRGFIYFDWNASVEDAAGGTVSREKLVQNAVDTALGRKKVVLLAHDRVENTALALEALIDAFPDYQIKPLSENVTPIQF